MMQVLGICKLNYLFTVLYYGNCLNISKQACIPVLLSANLKITVDSWTITQQTTNMQPHILNQRGSTFSYFRVFWSLLLRCRVVGCCLSAVATQAPLCYNLCTVTSNVNFKFAYILRQGDYTCHAWWWHLRLCGSGPHLEIYHRHCQDCMYCIIQHSVFPLQWGKDEL